MDLVPWGVTFFVSLLVGLEYGILCGFIISVIFLLYYAARPRVRINSAEVINLLRKYKEACFSTRWEIDQTNDHDSHM